MSSLYSTTPLWAQTPGPGKEVPPTPTLLLPFGSQYIAPLPPISTVRLLRAGTWWILPTTFQSCGRDGTVISSLTHLPRSFTPGSLTMHSCTPAGASMMVGAISPECACQHAAPRHGTRPLNNAEQHLEAEPPPVAPQLRCSARVAAQRAAHQPVLSPPGRPPDRWARGDFGSSSPIL